MHTTSGQTNSHSKTYKINLFEKELKVQLMYESPQGQNRYQKNINASISLDSIKQKSVTMQADAAKLDSSKPKKKGKGLDQRQKQFYADQIQQGRNILQKYEEFHQHFAEGKIKQGLKVYSNSKLHITGQNKINLCGFVPIREVNISNNIQDVFAKKASKIKLYINRNDKSSFQKSPEKNWEPSMKYQNGKPNEIKKQELTPSKSRNYNLQVTTSKSRGKNESMMSNRQQLSIDIRKFQLKNYSDSPTQNLGENILRISKIG